MKIMMVTNNNLTRSNRTSVLVTQLVSIAPLAVFRVLFGGMMLASIIRFTLKGWINTLYIKPVFYFSYYGFEWVKPLSDPGMYILFLVMALAALFLMLGLFYRFSAILFFTTFTYVELIDKTNYLNHYYFVSIIAFLLIFLPAGCYFSLDAYRKPQMRLTQIPRLFILILQLQLGIVYFFAGVAKLNADWLLHAMPLRIWLPAHTDFPLIGSLLDKVWIAYFFSWFGALYDLSIPFLLLFKKTRGLAYFFVIAFHLMTFFLFQIGMFPFIMIICTLIFFPENIHQRILEIFTRIIDRFKFPQRAVTDKTYTFAPFIKQSFFLLLIVHFTLQVLIPFRFLLYPGKLFWTEQGYRFSWRVMLMEKAGKAFFYVTDPATKRSGEAMMDHDLTANQEKMMATQPDMILQYAHFLKDKYIGLGIKKPEIRVESYVSLNGSGSRLFIDKSVDLTKEQESFKPKDWILPFEEQQKP
jgi:hypothetical protein